jgi:hypothetical protein
MKKLLIAVFALLSMQTFAQRWETIKGNTTSKRFYIAVITGCYGRKN